MKKKAILVTVILMIAIFAAGFYCGRTDWQELKQKAYVHKDYISGITKEECFLCGDNENSLGFSRLKPNNLGILDLNSFEVHHIEINRYEDSGALATAPSGVFTMDGMETATGRVQSNLDSDNGYSHVYLTGVQYEIDTELVQNRLCQDCLDGMNTDIRWAGAPAEFAVVNYEERTIHPLVPCTTAFGMGDYLVDCQFRDHGEIRLLIAFLPNRYES